MIHTDLTIDRKILSDGSSAFPYLFHGQEILIRDDAKTAIKIFNLFQDKEADENIKAIEIIESIFVDAQEAYIACDFDNTLFGELINSVIWEIYGIDNQGGNKTTSEPLWDLDEDSALIRISLRMAYGVEWDEIREKIPWSEFIYMVSSLPHETPLGMRIYYRNINNKPKKTKYNKEQIDEFMRFHKLFALKPKQTGSHDSAEVANTTMNDFALALCAKKKR